MRSRAGMYVALGVVVAGLAFARAWLDVLPEQTTFGVTYSTSYAWQLGLEVRESYSAVLDDLGVRDVRLPVYWWEVEGQKDVFEWGLYDWIMDESAKRGVRVTMAIGAKVPRWPECYIPNWAWLLNETQRREEQLAFVEEAVRRYGSHPALSRWQVENEAFFPFGICPAPNPAMLERETDLVRKLDSHPIQVTVSGELEPYLRHVQKADFVGLSLYRITFHPLYGYSFFFFPPEFYRVRSWVLALTGQKMVISELQGEPWFPFAPSPTTPGIWYEGFDVELLKEHAAYARRTHASEVFFWGVEWWYFLKQHGDDRLWGAAKEIF